MLIEQSSRILEKLIVASGNIKSRGHVALIGEMMNAYKILVRKLDTPEGKILFGRPMCR
jgi:hypothetical protein